MNINVSILITKLGDRALNLNNIDVNKKIKLISTLAECEQKYNKMCNNKIIIMNIIGAFVEVKI